MMNTTTLNKVNKQEKSIVKLSNVINSKNKLTKT